MDRFAEFLKPLTELARQHVPTDAVPPWWFAAAVMLVFGVAVCVLGAKLARWFISVCFAAAGMAAGVKISAVTDISSPGPAALVGGLVVGGIGYMLHRLWVGVLAGCFAGLLVFGTYSSQKITPHLIEFNNSYQLRTIEDFHVGAADGQAPKVDWDHLREYLHEFGDYLEVSEPSALSWGGLSALGAAVVGFMLGAIFCRLTLILFTATFGALSVACGVALLGQGFGIDVYETCKLRPEISAAAVASFFLVSVGLQYHLTRAESRKRASLTAPAD
jgi:hypothetical protein